MKHKFWGYVGGAFLVYFMVTNPSGAATTAKSIAAGLGSVADGIGKALVSLLT
jgi:hypothetical protein